MVSGFSLYQSEMYMEQTPEAVHISTELMQSYGLEFRTPILEYSSLDDVKFQLLDFGVTTKSLEAVSIFADSFSIPSPRSVVEYMTSKLDTCRRYIDMKVGGLNG
ncbi:hypothetical protein CR970_02320 [Candidatus Saccharibacteria bacterium]|nr:MAG: hypothetical protein CR970_02320 [Candidatus Saccharibacteria bacterium]